MASIILKDLTVTYNRQPALHHISGEFAAGSLTAIAGPNGAGKSTLLKTIAGILKPNDGELVIKDATKSEIAYLPQASEIERDFPLTINQLVSLGFWHRSGAFAKISNAQKTKVADALQRTGLEGLSNVNLSALSAGQFQRALFARILVQDAKIILLDEPFNAIDDSTVISLLPIIREWHAEKRTVICVLHDHSQIKENFPSCLLLARTCVSWGDSKTVLAA